MITMFTIEAMRVHVGLDENDNSQDAAINAIMETAIAMAESYCDRKFQIADDSEIFVHVAGYSISLRRFPVNSIASVEAIENTGTPPPYHAYMDRGIIFFDGRLYTHQIEVSYNAGYGPTTVPADLQWSIYRMFDVLWSAEQGNAVAAGSVKQAKIGDLSISYETGAASTALADGLIPLAVGAVLNRFKRFSA